MKMKELVQEGWKLLDITNDEKLKAEYDSWCRKVKGFLNQNGFPKGKLNEIQIKMWYTENEFSKDDTRNSIIKAIKDTVVYLDEINTISEAVISEAVGIRLIEQILNNFYLYYRSMFQNPLHKKATMSMDELKKIQIGNEYDLYKSDCSAAGGTVIFKINKIFTKNLQRKKNMNAEDFCFCFLLNFLSSRSLMLFV